jgi:hypothetical protein
LTFADSLHEFSVLSKEVEASRNDEKLGFT